MIPVTARPNSTNVKVAIAVQNTMVADVERADLMVGVYAGGAYTEVAHM